MVKVHAMAAPVEVAAASSVTVRVAMLGVAVPPAPSPLQVIEASVKPAGGADSVIVVTTAAAVSVCVAPETPTPGAAVVMVCGAKPLLPVKPNAPTPPFDTLVTVTVGGAGGGAAQAPGTVMVLELVETVPPNAKALPVKLAPSPTATPAASRIFPTKVLAAPSVVAPAGAQNTLPAQAPPAKTTREVAPVVTAPPVDLKM